MATLNVGTMAARLGLDPSEFLEKMKGVQGFNGFVSGEMKRQWKQTARDGQEGLRLIDEALGIHVARPVARIVAETLPGLSKALSSIIGGVAFSALGYAFVEFGENIVKKIDEAKKKEEEYADAVRKTKTVAAESSAENERRLAGFQAKLAGLHGDAGAEHAYKIKEIDIENVERLAKQVDDLTAAERREQQAAADLMGFWSGLGNIFRWIWEPFDTTKGMDQLSAKAKEFQEHFSDLARLDGLKGTTTAVDYLNAQLAAAHDTVIAMKAEAALPPKFFYSGPGAGPSDVKQGPSKETIDAWTAYEKVLHDASDRAKQVAAGGQAQKDIDDAENKKKLIDLSRRWQEEVRAEVAAVQHAGDAMQVKADSAAKAAEATGKGTAASILAAAAAESEKAAGDLLASAQEKYDSRLKRRVADTQEFRDALAAVIPRMREAALLEQGFHSSSGLEKNVADFSTRVQERISELQSQAEGHNKVAEAQAKETKELIPQQQGLDALRATYESMKGLALPTGFVGPPSAAQAGYVQFGHAVDAAAAALEKAKGEVTDVNAAIQSSAFAAEMQKIREETDQLSGADLSVWGKMEAKIRAAVESGAVLPEQIGRIRAALMGLQGEKIIGEFSKLDRELQATLHSSEALARGTPFGELWGKAAGLAHEYGMSLDQVHARLLAVAQASNIEKAWSGADALNASGGKMGELQAQMASLRGAANTGQVKSDSGETVTLSGDALDAVRLKMQEITAEEDAVLLRTGGVAAGFRAWVDALQVVESEGQFVFNLLTQAEKGFESTAADSLIKIIESHHEQHAQLIHQLRQMWQGYFAGLAKMAIQGGMKKLLAPVAGAMEKTFHIGGSAVGKDGALVANTEALHELTAAITAKSGGAGGFMVPGMGGFGAGAGAAGAAADPVPFVPLAAEGGDFSPGGSFISGEAGAERVDLERGGAHVTPLGFTMGGGGGGGDTHNHYDMRGAVVTDDLMRKADAAEMARHTESSAVAKAVSISREASLRSRPQR